SGATVAGSAARRAGGEWAAADVTGILRSTIHAQTGTSVLSRRRGSVEIRHNHIRAGGPAQAARYIPPASPHRASAPRPKAPVAELVDALDSKSSSARSAGSIPARGTTDFSSQANLRDRGFQLHGRVRSDRRACDGAR